MVPIHRDLYKVGVSQPLLFVNSGSWQWVKNVQCMMKLAKPPGSDGKQHYLEKIICANWVLGICAA